jgi:hypothetical protein
MSYSDYERVKWEVLAHLFHRLGPEAAWFEARQIEPEDGEAQAALARRLVLDLLDSGLIFGAYASRSDGYNLDVHEFVPVSREAVIEELDRGDWAVVDEENLLWLLPTEKAEEVWQSLPPEAFMRPESAPSREATWTPPWASVRECPPNFACRLASVGGGSDD